MTTATGYAVALNGMIGVRTVSPDKRGAIVNWLVVTAGVPIYANTSDATILALWEKNRVRFPITELFEVSISLIHPATV